MHRRAFIGGLASLAALLCFRRAQANSRLREAYQAARLAHAEWWAYPAEDRYRPNALQTRWEYSNLEMSEAACAAGLPLTDRVIMLYMVILPPKDAESLRRIYADECPMLMQKLGHR
jgi:hypothetical protein